MTMFFYFIGRLSEVLCLYVSKLRKRIEYYLEIIKTVETKIEIDGNGEKIEIDGNGDKIEIDGNGEKIEIDGNGDKIEIDGNGDKIEIDGNGDKLNSFPEQSLR
jgi:RNase P/RNase MRP subunit p29